MDTPLVSVIMPAYNAADFIPEAINSVKGQTYQNWELIIVDDGSTDNTAAIVRPFLSDNRIKLLTQSNKKQGAARNLAINNSSGKYLAFIDADDVWLPKKLALQTELINQNLNIDLLFSQGYKIDGNDESDFNVEIKDTWDINDLPAFIDQNQIPILSVLVKKDAVLTTGMFTEYAKIQNAEDYHLWLKLLVKGYKFKSTADRLFKYRVHSGQSTYDDNNLSLAVYFMMENLFYSLNNMNLRKLIVSNTKWKLFDKDMHTSALQMITEFLRAKKKNVLVFVINNFLSRPVPFQQRAVFKLISNFA